MFCNNCGKQVNDDTTFCPYCGTDISETAASAAQPIAAQTAQPTDNSPAPEASTAQQPNTIAIVGFVFAFLFPLVGLICSIIGCVRAVKNNATNKGLAIAGIVISAVWGIAEFIFSITVIFPALLMWLIALGLANGPVVETVLAGALALPVIL